MGTIVDLTLRIHEGMPTFPGYWHPFVEIAVLGRHGIEGRSTRKLVLGTHTGTHIDAPLHFLADGDGVDSLSLAKLVGPAVVADVRPKAARDPITVDDLTPYEAEIEQTGRVLIYTGWLESKYEQPDYFSGRPYMTREACEWLIGRSIKLVGFDMPDFDDPNESTLGKPAPYHVLFLSHGVAIVEGLCNLGQLSQRVVELIALPLKVGGGDGAPARVIAIEQ